MTDEHVTTIVRTIDLLAQARVNQAIAEMLGDANRAALQAECATELKHELTNLLKLVEEPKS